MWKIIIYPYELLCGYTTWCLVFVVVIFRNKQINNILANAHVNTIFFLFLLLCNMNYSCTQKAIDLFFSFHQTTFTRRFSTIYICYTLIDVQKLQKSNCKNHFKLTTTRNRLFFHQCLKFNIWFVCKRYETLIKLKWWFYWLEEKKIQ